MYLRVRILIVGLLVFLVCGCSKVERGAADELTETEQIPLKELAPEKEEIVGGNKEGVKQLAGPKGVAEEKISIDEPARKGPRSTYREYIVQKGDTLYKIARRFYGKEQDWRRIWQANIDKLPDPNNLKVGMKLIIP